MTDEPYIPKSSTLPKIDLTSATANPILWTILAACNKGAEFVGKTLIALDPGETTGFARLRTDQGPPRFEMGQIPTKDLGLSYDILEDLFFEGPAPVPDHVRFEDYKVYGWMADTHAWSSLHTVQLIGAIRILGHKKQIPMTCKLAQQAKAFWTDEKLKACGLYIKGQRHARDAVRHLLYMMAFPGKTDPL